ncbi:5-formyltetrahydrofolate cyclo-ligase [Chryseobacterium contaminans]|uniref:5-formyltetrahydrofolate cyclo-ligase n=2 Tax=Chryseobacterium contaminans TaxID=1423959 RepID=A0A1M6WE72_9FLAO|nr:5-formyltetrahydrofolate cyclo-ligase [Chryseobacterium contaminans]
MTIMLKAELRKKYMQQRKALSHDEAFLLSEKIFQNFITYFKPHAGQKIHIFIPIQKFNEIDTQIFINYFLAQNIRVYVPKIVADKLINIEVFSNTLFETNSWGISEPVSNEDSGEVDFHYVITPLLYCDRNGNRVGYGKGFYDGLFQSISPETKKIGVNYFDPDDSIDDVWENDIPLDYLVTPTEVLSFLSGLE